MSLRVLIARMNTDTLTETNNSVDRLLGWPELQRTVGLSRPMVWRLRRDGVFPAPVRLSKNRVGWLASEIQSWIRTRERA